MMSATTGSLDGVNFSKDLDIEGVFKLEKIMTRNICKKEQNGGEAGRRLNVFL